jgi:hypothetical protein
LDGREDEIREGVLSVFHDEKHLSEGRAVYESSPPLLFLVGHDISFH